MRDRKVFDLILFGLFLAIIAVLTMPPSLGYFLAIPALGVNLTIIHIPVIIGAIILKRNYAYLLGFVFGVTCFMLANNMGIILFQNPIIAILPRVLFGFFAYEIYNIIKIKNRTIHLTLTMILSTLIHTVLVLICVFIFGKSIFQTNQDFVTEFLLPIISLNGFLEIVLAVVIGVPLTSRLLKILEVKYADTY